ncbi:hypothetical protein PEP31012_03583 [Pandoraea eparura]|uniref:Zinc ribbon domain-containing protein n=1 Tax=Pandoraea eparura TaxID=2508291 RepID=A0A5E4WWS1_9BURK|nr:hypothetical protein [Pandoraea eparura]VVE29308.1 hypothetical protein PEP31012_03583 [Pandoraea eparura]
MSQRFRNPANGYTEEVDYNACFEVFFLGPLYLAAKGLWGHVFIWLAVVMPLGIVSGGFLFLATIPVASICYAFSIQGILQKKYLSKGWVIEEDEKRRRDPWASKSAAEPTLSALTKLCPFCAEEIKVEAIRCKHCQADLSAKPTA